MDFYPIEEKLYFKHNENEQLVKIQLEQNTDLAAQRDEDNGADHDDDEEESEGNLHD